ncbi:zinc finger domain-containing protein [Methanoplanus endosymbiosus]|uniref:Zinc finger domain-containing protein n=1 Tax=Methanoplanus endosymbiosus TaxID=33865 RepID=A0A9E7PK31_9EURY|nr:zinc finger domain-containing protein [Methanoplanus endosymbiosus]UUX91180.1 zinc finger domain-containing protein [Methanoplanus endosymbiosus]
MSVEKCTSCKAPLSEPGWTKFECPKCRETIYRCHRCRHQSVPYTCQKCGFEGP